MIKDLFIDKIVTELRSNVLKEFNKKKKNISEDRIEIITDIINKEKYSIEDISYLLNDYLTYDVNNDSLINLISNKKKVDSYVLNIIYSYFVINSSDKKNLNLIINKLGYNYNINDIEIIDKYLKNKEFNDNTVVLDLIEKIYNFEVSKDNSLFKDKICELRNFKLIVDKNLLPNTLVKKFVDVKGFKNLYYGLKEIEKVMINNESNKKDMLLIYWTYNYLINHDLEKYFCSIDVNIEDIVKFIKFLESNRIILDEVRLNNLLKEFRKYYYTKNNLSDKYKELSSKVISEYSNYYDKYFYFKNENFISYYNELYGDDFSCFVISNNKVLLNKDIFNGIFDGNSLLGNYLFWKEYLDELKTFKKIKNKAKKIDKDQNDFCEERRKFYRKYKVKVNEFVNDGSVCIKYFMFKNIESKDRVLFYELFKKINSSNYKELELNKDSLRVSADRLKIDFVEELFNHSFKNRYLVKEKYIEYTKYIGCESYIKNNYYDLIIEEVCRKYYLLIAKDILYRLNTSMEDKMRLFSVYKELEEFVGRELGVDSLDDVFNSLSNKRNKDIKLNYFNIKMMIENEKKLLVKIRV